MTSNITINTLLYNEQHFIGCFHINSLPTFPLFFPKSFIIYTNGHWVSVLLVDKITCLYFDSFGEPIKDNDLISYLGQYYNKIIYNSLKIQDDNSDKCGQFCMGFVKFVHNQIEFDNFLKLFKRKFLIINDTIIYNLLILE